MDTCGLPFSLRTKGRMDDSRCKGMNPKQVMDKTKRSINKSISQQPNQSINQPINQPTNQAIKQAMNQSSNQLMSKQTTSIQFVQFSSVQDCVYKLGMAHMCSTPSLRSFPNIAFETVPMLVSLTMALSRPLKDAFPRSAPVSSRRLMV